MSWSTQSGQKKALSIGLVLATLIAGILIGTLVNTDVQADKNQAATDATPLTIPSPVELTNDFTVLVKKMEPAVVNISTSYEDVSVASQRRGQPQDQSQGDDNMDRFRRFFGLPDPGEDNPQPNRRGGGTGSGFLVDPKGYIITNHHVVEGADKIMVRLHGDDTDYKAKLIGVDIETDLAVIKIDAGKTLPFAMVGNSDGVQVGDWAVAIGSPFGLEASVTAGIVSAKGRDIGAQQFQRFIQTDAAINPGNSGGPLLNIQGQVIGVNTMIATNSGANQGIGFALPVNTAVKVYNQLISQGKVTRGSIGIRFDQAKPELLKALGVNHGVLVEVVTPGGPAEQGGLKAEDIILDIDGKPVADGDDLVARVADTPLGQKLAITVDRGGKRLTVDVAVRDRAEVFADDPRFRGTQPTPKEDPKPEVTEEVRFGVGVRALTPAEQEERGLDSSRGLIVTRVMDESFAGDIGVQPNDVILSINRQPVASVEDIRRLQATMKPGDPVAFYLMRETGLGGRGGQKYTSLYVSGTLPR